MIPPMQALTPRRASPARDIRRDRENGIVAGVCAGLAKRLGVDPLLLRIVFAATALASGVGLVAYVLAWILLPAQDGADSAARGLTQGWGRRGTVEVALGVGFLLLAVLLAFRRLGLPFSDLLIWPLVLVAAGGALIWHRSASGADPIAESLPRVNLSATASAVLRPAAGESRPAVISRIGIGVTLVIAAAIVFLQFSGALAAATDVALAALVVAIAFGVIFAPWIVRLAQSLSAERAERIRSQERAEVAAHLHDSVLQTLALVQKRAGDPRAVAALARRQERELRSWLSGTPARDDPRLARRRHRGRARARAAGLMSAASDARMPRVVLVDDHELFRAGVRSELDGLVDVVGDAATVAEAVAAIAELRPDVVLLDVHMPDGGGLEVIRRLRAGGTDSPGVQFLALSVSDAAEDVIAVIRAGARGYVTKTISGAELADAVRRVHGGDAVFSPRLAGFVLDAFAGAAPAQAGGRGAAGSRGRDSIPAERDAELDTLTPREREVLQHIARGYMYKEIAHRLGISAKTVEAHVSAVLRKLQLSSRHELSRWAAERRMLDDGAPS